MRRGDEVNRLKSSVPVALILLCVIPIALFAVRAGIGTAESQAAAQATPAAPPGDAGELTEIQVYVLSRGGKFIGDDIGGAEVALRDARTGEFLAAGRTRGSAGDDALMTVARTRTQPIPTTGVAVFTSTLMLDAPRLLEFQALAPLGGQGSANRITTTEWVLPASFGENRIVLEIPGLNVQVVNPPTHFLPAGKLPLVIPLRVNVTMMCGCPIGPAYPWKPENYSVKAVIKSPDGARDTIALQYDNNAPDDAPSQFVGSYTATKVGVYQVDVIAWQNGEDNVGSERITFIIP
jgi:hypothetical protein